MYEIVEFVVAIFLTVLIISALIFGLAIIGNIIIYVNNVSYITVQLDGKEIYSGRNVFVGWSQLGEVGNKYSVDVYERTFWGKFWGKTLETYVGDNLIVTNN